VILATRVIAKFERIHFLGVHGPRRLHILLIDG